MRALILAKRKLQSGIRRCPACGHRLSHPVPPDCPLCKLAFGDERITGTDRTPYARSYAHGVPGLRLMCEWVWCAGSGRLKHIALMRSSAASRRFARTQIALLALGFGLFQLGRKGWYRVSGAEQGGGVEIVKPTGQGWIHVAAAPRPLELDLPDAAEIDLWWNLPQATLGVAAAMLLGLLLLWLTMLLVQAGVRSAHRPQYRSEQRMTAAMHYSTAWIVPIFAAVVIFASRPIAYIGSMAQWGAWWTRLDTGLLWSGAAVAGTGIAMWWFWLARLGFSAPPKTRWRVAAFFGFALPVIVGGASYTWYYGLDMIDGLLVQGLRLQFFMPA